MKISIVISTYNGEKYIIKQLESLREQTRQADEVLIFDDCSSDNTCNLINEYINEYNLNNWILCINNINKGWKKNFIEGMWKCTGDLIFPCDQDDIWDKDKLKKIERVMLDNGDIKLLVTNYKGFYESGKIVYGPNVVYDKKITKLNINNFNIFKIEYPGCVYCVRKSLINLSKRYWESDFPHDALLLRMAIFSDSAYCYNEFLINWRKHIESTYTIESKHSKNLFEKKKWISYAIRVAESLQKFIQTENCKNKEIKMKIVNKYIEWCDLRKRFMETGNVFIGIKLLMYLKCYSRFKQYIGDWYLVYWYNK